MSRSRMVRYSSEFDAELKALYKQYCEMHGRRVPFTEFTRDMASGIRLLNYMKGARK